MARVIWTGALAFGLVNIPVGLYSATEDRTVHFNQFQKGTSDRIRYKRVNERTGEEINYRDIVKGREVDDDTYVLLTDEELESVEPGRTRTIDITDFVDLAEVDPIYFQRTYYLAPRGDGADRSYALLHQAMAETNRAGIATLVMRSKEYLVAVRPQEEILALETMYFADEIRSPIEELETLPRDASFQGRELDVAKRLVESLTVPWAPGDYHNTYRARVEELIEHKREGQAVVFEAERPKSNVIDLMAALEASVANMGPGAAGGTGGTGGSGTRAGGPRAGGARADGARADGARANGTRASGSGARESGSSRSRGRGGAAAGRGREPGTASGPADLAALSKADLLARAAGLDIPGRSKMSKPELIKAIQAAGRPKRGARKIS